MEKGKLAVLVVEPEKKPYVKEISSGLESLQKEVGGYIQALYPFEGAVAIICDEEAKLKDSQPNRALRGYDGKIYDVVYGTFIMAGLGEGDFTSMSDDMIKKYSEHFGTPEAFINLGGRIMVVPIAEPKERSERESVIDRLHRNDRTPQITPLYMNDAAYAFSHGEGDDYRASLIANVECRNAIGEAIGKNYNDNSLDVSFAKGIVDTYGAERVQAVLAATISASESDGRITLGNKTWAKDVPLPKGDTSEYRLNKTHPGLVDIFCRAVRKLQTECDRKPSVIGKLQNTIPKDSPKKPTVPKKPVL